MKTKISLLILVSGLAVFGFNACKDDPYANEKVPDREFMTQFRNQKTTGIGDDARACQTINYNDAYLSWYGVEGARGYRIKVKPRSGDWNNPDALLYDITVGPDVLNMTIEDLQYETWHRYAIQVLSERGDEHNSLWFGLGDGQHTSDYFEMLTQARPGVPEVMSVSDVTTSSVRIWFELDPDIALTDDGKDLNDSFEVSEDGKFIMQAITIAPSNDFTDVRTIYLTAEDFERGYIEIDGLISNMVYIINGLNNNVDRYWDQLYNSLTVRIKGELGDPVPITHKIYTNTEFTENENELLARQLSPEWNACRIDQILSTYMNDSTMTEGTTFLLEAGKTYFIQGGVNISKGLTLKCEDPNNRATVLMGLGRQAGGNAVANNFGFGRAARPGEIGSIDIESIIFENIIFDAPFAFPAVPADGVNNGSGNYFVNQSSTAMPFVCDAFELRNCDFKGFMRGWVRVQGASRKVIRRWIVDNCLFYDNGPYDSGGGGYGYFGDGDHNNARCNFFSNVELTNTSFIGSPLLCLFRERDNLNWPEGTVWNIKVENCTFLNFNTLHNTNGRFFWFNSNPRRTNITFKNNLIILTKAAGDPREMRQPGMTVFVHAGVQFDIADNYSTNAYLNEATNQIFSSLPFSSNTDAAGANDGLQNIGGMEELTVKLGANPISPADLMVDPNPVAFAGRDMHKYNLDGIYFRNTDAVRNHEIFKKNIGDPRWRKNVTP